MKNPKLLHVQTEKKQALRCPPAVRSALGIIVMLMIVSMSFHKIHAQGFDYYVKDKGLVFIADSDNNNPDGDEDIVFGFNSGGIGVGANWVEGLRINDNTGYVGIGNTNPNYKLDLGNNPNPSKVLAIHTSGTGPSDFLYGFGNDNRNGIGYLDIYAGAATSSPKIVVGGDGNTGIGTTGPTAPLHVTASSDTLPSHNGLYVYNPVNAANQDAILSARVAGASAGDAFMSFDIANEAGWSVGLDNQDDNKFKIVANWNYLETDTRLTINTNGDVGIGTTDPTAPLHVTASSNTSPSHNGLYVYNPVNAANQDAILSARVAGASAGDAFMSFDIANEAGWSVGLDNQDGNKFKIAANWNYLETDTRLTINTNGNVGIGTTGPVEKLEVVGTVKATSFVSSTASFPDYVFADTYEIMPLHELETYVKQHRHLPNMPAEKEVVEDGLNIPDVMIRSVEHIETIYLHLIKMQKEIKALQQENATLKQQLRKGL